MTPLRVALFALTVATIAVAGNPPSRPPAVLPPKLPPPAVPITIPAGPKRAQPLTPALLNKAPISPWLRDMLLAEMQGTLKPHGTSSGEPDVPPGEAAATSVRARTRTFRPQANLSGTNVNPTAISNDAEKDQEPVIGSNYYCNAFGCTEKVYAAYMKRPTSTPSAPKIHAWSRFSGADVQLPFQKDPLNTDMDVTGDPAFATNSWTAGYIVGTSYNSNYTTLSVWRTTDAGVTWSQPVNPICNGCVHQRTDTMLYDKPAIAVSYYSQTWAYVYVVAPFIDDTGQQTSTFYVSESTDGGDHFYAKGSVAGDGPTSASSQIVVDNANGWLYLFFLTWANNSITVYRSINQGADWSWISTVSTPELLRPNVDLLCPSGGPQSACLQARSMLTAMFNPSTRTVGLTFHARVSTTDRRAKPFFYSFNLDPPASWLATAVSFVGGEAGSQWNPAIDYDQNGNFLVSYYDRRDPPPVTNPPTPSDVLYKVYVTKLYPNGSHVYADQAVTATFADPREDATKTFPLGEYQGLWTFDQNVYAGYVFTRIAAQNQEDIYYTAMALP
jgi:hypothetical protein